MAAAALASTWATRVGPERTQVVLHVGLGALTSDDSDAQCHLADGPGLCPETARRLGCDVSVTVARAVRIMYGWGCSLAAR